MKKNRPVNLNITKIHFPAMAIASILHRVSGVILFLLIPFSLWLLNLSLATSEGFMQLREFFSYNLVLKLLVWLLLAAFIYHLLAGIRHIVMDAGFAESLKGGRYGAYFTMLLSLTLIALVGVCLW